MPGTVLIAAQDGDTETDMVARALLARGASTICVDTADFPLELAVAARSGTRWRGTLRTPLAEARLETVSAVYYRRPARFRLPAQMSGPERQFAEAEAIAGLGGLLGSLPCLWVNHPSRAADAEFKPMQLQTATACRMRIPRTLLTNDAQAVREFAASLSGPVVYKPLAGGVISELGGVRLIYTTIVEPPDLDDRQIRLTAHLFQEWVEKSFDARVTAVGERVFAVAVRARTPIGRVDWRADYAALEYEAIELPGDVRASVVEYLRRFGLSMGAFDFAVTPDGSWYFLECNPQGRWGWIEEMTGTPISTAIADLLRRGNHDRD
jgi:ATP-grasp ribosomal peptide maturase